MTVGVDAYAWTYFVFAFVFIFFAILAVVLRCACALVIGALALAYSFMFAWVWVAWIRRNCIRRTKKVIKRIWVFISAHLSNMSNHLSVCFSTNPPVHSSVCPRECPRPPSPHTHRQKRRFYVELSLNLI